MGVIKADAFYPQTQQIANGGTAPVAAQIVTIPSTASQVKLVAPTLTPSTVKLQVSEDGTNYRDCYKFGSRNGADAAPIIWTVPSGTGGWCIDISDLALPGYKHKIVCGSAQGAARTFTFLSR